MRHLLCPPELEPTTILFGLAIFFCGCSSSYSVRSSAVDDAYSYGIMNEELAGKQVEIELKDGRDISAKKVRISDDSVSWVDQRTDEESKMSIRQLDKICMKNHFLGSLEGMVFGLVGGGVVGGLVERDPQHGREPDIGAVVGFLVGACTGSVVGLVTGLIVGHSYNYEFPTTEQSDSLQNGK